MTPMNEHAKDWPCTYTDLYRCLAERHPEWSQAEACGFVIPHRSYVYVHPDATPIIVEILLEEIARYDDVRRILQPILTRGWLSKAIGIPSENQNER